LIKVNRPIDFPALVFLVLLALILLLNGSAILSKASRPTSGSGRAIDRAAEEKVSLVRPHVVELFSNPVEAKVSANYQRAYPSIDSGLNQATKKLSDVPSFPKNHVQPRGHRLTANLVTRFHARPVHLGESRQKGSAFWKEIRINGRRLKKRLASLLRSVPSSGKRSLNDRSNFSFSELAISRTSR
jgi:hypothetical protein